MAKPSELAVLAVEDVQEYTLDGSALELLLGPCSEDRRAMG
eukprot:CAMPEP_0168444242 /NCGR_PEP_ID=MMETSP0228-20121227/44945_1 /TAXON_ID=133427 /ORGANISM="Protoceratium reticulatum, Strain CCCM 535 (=CCMP 1889)" /LENGTH=40 /DNA_ID= /DNA_START= /DNA_END= /DNA_ORIENTATION=